MAWTAPRTWQTGETVTASLMNTHVKDNLDYLKTQVDTALLNPPAFYSHTSNEEFATGAWETVSEMSGTVDPWSMEAAGVATIPTDGFWSFNAMLAWDGYAAGVRNIRFYKNGTTYLATVSRAYDNALSPVQLSWTGWLAASDTVAFQAYQNTGVTLGLSGSDPSLVYWSGVRVSLGTA